jgi:ankyrin repeat protein
MRKDNDGYTPLHCAAWNGHVDILHLLVENGADLEAQDNDGWRALHLRPIMVTCLSFKNSYQDTMLISMRE